VIEGRYRAYAEYQDSGVGYIRNIPSHWKTASLSKLFYIKAGGDVKTDLYSDTQTEEHPHPIYTNTKDEKAIYGYTSKSNYPPNSITVSGRGEVGVAAFRDHPYDAIIRLLVLIPQRKCSCKFFAYFINKVIDFRVESSAIGQLSTLQISPYKVVFPSLKEQEQIARFLDHETAKIDALIEKQQQLIALLKEKRQAVISHAVTKGLNPDAPMKHSGVEWLGAVPGHWDVCQLKFKTLNMQTGPFGSQLHAEDYVENGIPLINPAHIVDGELLPDPKCSVDGSTQNRLARHQLCGGDLLLARRGELGRCAVVSDDQQGWLCGTGSLRATLSLGLVPDYAYMLVSSEGVRVELALESKGSTMDNLNTETLGKIRLPVPPVQEQRDILGYVNRISTKYDQTELLAKQQVTLLQERRTALISATVTGKIDVRNWQPPIETQANKDTP
jgi:type I restriction enzyme S subunit